MDAAQHTPTPSPLPRRWWWMIVAAVVAIDQASKYAARASITQGDSVPSPDAFVRLVHTYNTGISFSLFDGSPDTVRLVTLTLTAGLIAIFAAMRFTGRAELVGGAMFVGGAVGNVIDRQYLEGVTDFFKVGSFPAFNVADACIVVGVATFIVATLLHDRRTMRQEGPA